MNSRKQPSARALRRKSAGKTHREPARRVTDTAGVPNNLLRARIAAGTVAAVALASVLTAAPASASIAEPARPAYSMAVALLSEISDAAPVFGVADSELYNLDSEELTARLTEMRGLGVTDLRVAVPWVYIEPAAGTYDWSKMDAVVQKATELGFTLTGAVTSTPTWAGLPLAGAPNPGTYANFAGTVAARYGSQITNYEVWNEPNGVIFYAPVSAASYTRMLQAAYTAIKAANPDAVVLAGSLGATGDLKGVSVTPQRFLEEMYAAGAAGYFDALSYHPYHFTLPFSAGAGTYNAPLDQVRKLYELMVANGDGDKQIWATEYGTATTPGWGVTQTEQAALLRDFLTAWSKLSYAGPAFVYTSKDVHTGILNHEFNFGLFTSNGSPKLAAQVLADLIAASLLGELPDYTAPKMSAARDAYLQVATLVFGLANQAMMLPNVAIGLVYNLMPVPLRRAFSAVANAVSAVVATVATAMTPAMEAMFGVLVRIVPQTPPRSPEPTEDVTPPAETDAVVGDGEVDSAVQVGLNGAGLATEPAVVDESVDGVAVDLVGELDSAVAAIDETVTETVAVEEPVVVDEIPGETVTVDLPADTSESDTVTGTVDEPVDETETETVDDDQPADDTDTDTADKSAAEESTEAEPAGSPKSTEKVQNKDTETESEAPARRAPRTSSAPSQDKDSSPAVSRGDRGNSVGSAPRRASDDSGDSKSSGDSGADS